MLVMLISGACNTLLMKFMVVQQVPTGPGAAKAGFDHPYFQSLLMMIGEFLCLIYFYATSDKKDITRSQSVPQWIFSVPCMLDFTATTLVNMAYVLIPASVVQMTRGAIVIFTCLLSVLCLGRRQHAYHVAGVVLVFLGITFVSLSAIINPSASTNVHASSIYSKMFGIGLCLAAQVFQASMIVYEEKIMGQYSIAPLQVVGMEGAFGIFFGVVILSVLNATGTESTPEAIYQMRHSGPLTLAIIGSIFSIAFFNFSGVTVTQRASATARSTIDVSRTIIIWAVELAVGWNKFNVLQLVGFVIVALGTLIYNRLIVIKALEPSLEASPLALDPNKEMVSSTACNKDETSV